MHDSKKIFLKNAKKENHYNTIKEKHYNTSEGFYKPQKKTYKIEVISSNNLDVPIKK